MSVLLAPSPTGVPALLHWGPDLGDTSPDDLAGAALLRSPGIPLSALDHPRHLGVLPDSTSGFTGTPALTGHRLPAAGQPDRAAPGRPPAWAARFRDWRWDVDQAQSRVSLVSHDAEAGLEATWTATLTEEGVLEVVTSVGNTGASPYVLESLRTVLPVPATATELLDLTGRWSSERVPQRHPWPQGTWIRAGRHGRTGHDATLLLLAGTPGFGFGSGEVYGVHVAWSGDHVTYAERTAEGECLLGGGELLGPGEVVLEQGGTYTSPPLVAAYSDRGMDGVSDRLHRYVRRRSPRSRSTRPVVLNTWEAVYFEQGLEPLTELAEAAAFLGVERFVLDDGWFLDRRDDTRGLGDWTVDPQVWPDGLGPLVERVRALGMEFGLWVEPEMVNEDSRLAREHPDWLLRGRESLPDTWRHQQVLDLQHPEAYAHVRDALARLLDEHDIAFLKWDHNRDLVDVAHDGRPAVHGQTLAFYRLLDELRAAHPELEIESCSSGGGRVDLGVLARTDRVWPSDTLDPLLRVDVQRWTSLLVPPDLVGSHVGGPIAHTTGRQSRLSFRAAVALLGHFGIEWDLRHLAPFERDALAAWVSFHKQVRHLVSSGRLVRPDHPDPALAVTGMVAQDGSEAVFVVAVTAMPATQHPAPVRLSGLDPRRRYRVRGVDPSLDRHALDVAGVWPPGGADGVVTTGAALARTGVALPPSAPETAFVLHLTAVGRDGDGEPTIPASAGVDLRASSA